MVVDDDSPDGTGDIVDIFKEKSSESRVHLLRHGVKRGLGSAYKDGLYWGLKAEKFTHFVTMDGDGSHRVEDLPEMLKAAGDADVVLGTRWMPGGSIVNWPRYREWISKMGTSYARWALRSPLRDLTGGFRVYAVPLLTNINLQAIVSEGYCFQIEMIRAAAASGAEFQEVPITFVERATGKSKMSRSVVMEALVRVSYWGLRARILPNADKLHYVK